MALVTAAAVAGTAATAMYLDGKYQIQKDLRGITGIMRAIQLFKLAEKKNRICLYYLFEASALRLGDEECIWSREGCYTWTQAYNKVNQYGQWFLKQGVKPGDLVGFYLMNSPDFMFAWLGLWSIGAAPAMINYNLAGKALLHCLKISGTRLLLVDEELALRARIEDVRADLEGQLAVRVIVVDSGVKAGISATSDERPSDAYREQVKADGHMCLFYTSGTTGMPKGCSFPILRGFERGVSVQTGLSLNVDGDRWYDCMPLYHGTGGVTAVTQLMGGHTLCIGKKFSTSKFWSDIRDSNATWFVYVGETARYLLAAPPSPLDRSHNVRGMYGNGLRPDVWYKFRERFGVPEVLEFFNSTEGMFALSNYCKGDYLAGAVGNHGLLMRYFTRNRYVPIRVDQVTGEIIRNPKTGLAYREPYEKGGEIFVAVRQNDTSPEIFPGYYNDEKATSKRYAHDILQKGDTWYRTGDALRRTKDGRWYFMDRLGDTFRWKGENVSTAEVSEVVGKFPGIVEANVYGVLLPNHDGRAGCAAIFIDPNQRNQFDFSALLRHSRTQLPRYAVPLFLRIVQQMTPIHNNKQNKVPLREEGIDLGKIKGGDEILWVPGGGETYQPFTLESWERLVGGRARL